MNVQANNHNNCHANIFTVKFSVSAIRYMAFSRWSYFVGGNSKISFHSLWFSPRLSQPFSFLHPYPLINTG